MINAVAAVQNVSTNPQQRETNPYTQQLLKVKNLIESSEDKRCYFDGPLAAATISYLTHKGFKVISANDEGGRYMITW